MKRLLSEFGAALFFAAALSFTVIPAVEAAAVTPNNVRNSSGGAATVVPVLTVDEAGNYVAGGGGGGAGDASAANQTSQITQATSTNTALGAVGDAAATQGSTGSVNAKLRTLTAQLNTQAGYLDGLEAALAALPQTNVVTNGGTFAVQATQAGTWTVQPGNTANTVPWLFQIRDAAGNARGANVNASNELQVNCGNCTGSGVSAADAAAFTAGSTNFAAGGGFFQTTATSNALTTGQQGAFQLTANRALFSNLRNAAGTEVGTSGTPLRTDPTGTTAQPVTNAGTFLVQNNAATPAGTNNIGDVDVLTLPALAAGTNGIGKLTANSGVDIGDVDVTSSALPTGAATSALQTTIDGRVDGLEGFVDGLETLIGTTNSNITAGTITTGTAGTPSAQVLSVQGVASGTAVPVSIASVPSHAVTNAGTFAVQNTAATPAGTNNIGDVDVLTLPALVAGTANIGDVDVLTSALPTGAATAAKQPALGTAGASSSDVISVQGIASGTALAVSVASIPSHAVTNAGTFAVQTGATAATAAAVPASANYIAGASDGGLAAGTAALTGLITCGNSVAIATAASGNTELVALTTSETIYICGYTIVAAGTVAAQLIYGTGTACATGETDLTGPMDLVANAGVAEASSFFRGMKGAVSNAFCIELSAAVAVNGVLYYTKF